MIGKNDLKYINRGGTNYVLREKREQGKYKENRGDTKKNREHTVRMWRTQKE